MGMGEMNDKTEQFLNRTFNRIMNALCKQKGLEFLNTVQYLEFRDDCKTIIVEELDKYQRELSK